ncbi:hypothetical protein [Galbibacter sp.]|uniref:hypothetical protein n=1 Tax=Galbibacter sp. TaxID=2918471 RepID=UPI003A8EFD11
MDCSQTWSKDNTVVLSPTNSTQQFGLEPLNAHFNTYQQSNSPGALSQLIPISDIAHIALPNNATCGIHYNGHQSTLGVIALLFPFHGFT